MYEMAIERRVCSGWSAKREPIRLNTEKIKYWINLSWVLGNRARIEFNDEKVKTMLIKSSLKANTVEKKMVNILHLTFLLLLSTQYQNPLHKL